MATVMARRALTSMGKGRSGAARPSRLPLILAHLISAIQDVVGPQDDGLVAATVRHLLRSGRLAGRGTGTRRPGSARRRCRRTWASHRWIGHGNHWITQQ
jgi:hypothetical protein